jgi:hypothetical protein
VIRVSLGTYWAGDVAQLVEDLLSKHEALIATPPQRQCNEASLTSLGFMPMK